MCGDMNDKNLIVILRCKDCGMEKNVSKDYPDVVERFKEDLKKTIEWYKEVIKK